MKLTPLLSTAIALVGVSAGPASPPPSQLQKRGPLETVYLTDCRTLYNGNTVWFRGEMNYYSDTNLSQNGEWPHATGYITSPPGQSTWTEIWDGPWSQIATFTEGVGIGTTFYVHLDHQLDHPGLAVGTQVGSGWNSYQTPFLCYKDNQRILYTKRSANNNPIECRARYYCMRGGTYPLK